VQTVVGELNGEKVDIVRWSDDPAEFIANALSPAKVVHVLIDRDSKVSRVIVPDHQLSLAIGRRGQNARLAAKLTGWKIDIKSETQAREEGLWDPEAENTAGEDDAWAADEAWEANTDTAGIAADAEPEEEGAAGDAASDVSDDTVTDPTEPR